MKKFNKKLNSEKEVNLSSEDFSKMEKGDFVVGTINEAEQNISQKEIRDCTDAFIKNKKKKLLKRGNAKSNTYIRAKRLQKRVTWKRRLFNFTVVLVLGVATGSILGGWYKDYVKSLTDVKYPDSDVEYIDNEIDIFSYALDTLSPTEDDMNNFVSILKAKGKTPKDFSPSQNIILANYNAKKATSYECLGEGLVSVVAMGLPITQTVTSDKKFDGKTYSFESLSKGTLSVANLSLMPVDGSTITEIAGKDISVNEKGKTIANWTGKKTTTGKNDYEQECGNLPNVLIPYTISSKTILNEDSVEIEETTYNDVPVYKYTINLHPIYGAIRYYKQVTKTSGLNGSPKFKDIALTVYIDSDWNFVRTENLEHYTVPYGIAADCTGVLNIDYKFNQPVEMPKY